MVEKRKVDQGQLNERKENNLNSYLGEKFVFIFRRKLPTITFYYWIFFLVKAVKFGFGMIYKIKTFYLF